jgi:hypothetical protein
MIEGFRGKPNGYAVLVFEDGDIIEEYEAGNHPHDSQVWISPNDSLALSADKLAEMAKSTALEMAQEHGIGPDGIECRI